MINQHPIRCRLIKTVIAPDKKNARVAMTEGIDKRAMPQTPWPEVHPCPMRVPNPTKKPPMIKR